MIVCVCRLGKGLKIACFEMQKMTEHGVDPGEKKNLLLLVAEEQAQGKRSTTLEGFAPWL